MLRPNLVQTQRDLIPYGVVLDNDRGLIAVTSNRYITLVSQYRGSGGVGLGMGAWRIRKPSHDKGFIV